MGRPRAAAAVSRAVRGGTRPSGVLNQQAMDRSGHELFPLFVALQDMILVHQRVDLGRVASGGGEDGVDPLPMKRD